MSDTNIDDGPHPYFQQHHVRPAASRGARRVTLEEKLRQEQQLHVAAKGGT